MASNIGESHIPAWLNGKFVDRDAAVVSAFDAGLQHGIGLFETLGAWNGRVFRAEAHAARLTGSAKALLLSESLRPGPLAEAVQHAVEHNGLDRARVRLTVIARRTVVKYRQQLDIPPARRRKVY